jgi:predicted phage-related endonuclease
MNLERITHDVQQGTGPWLRLREGFDTASEAPSALGVGKYTTRAQLLRRKHTGVAEEYSQSTLAKFRAGHEAEAAARPLAEGVAGGDLFPVTMSVAVGGLRLLASLDGITLDGDAVWETKLWNEELATAVRAGPDALPAHYTVQMDQELLVSGAQRCLFTCTDGTPERFVSCWYEADPAKFEALIDGWIQFRKELETYVLPDTAEPAPPVGKAPETLPALRIEVRGEVTASNLSDFKATALTAIRSVNRDLRTDQDFADAEKAVKWCADVESRLTAAKDHALSQTSSIDALFKAIDDISAEARRVRLDLDKLVARRKTEVKEEAVTRARRALADHVATLNAEIAPLRLLDVPADFPSAIKGLRSFNSMQDALDQLLATAKIAADGQARNIRANATTYQQLVDGHDYLFRDLGALVHKSADDFAAVMRSRIAEHQLAEQRRQEAQRQRQEAEARAAAQRQVEEAARVAAAAATAAAAQAAAPAPAVQATAPAPAPAPAPVVAPIPLRPAAPAVDEPATLKLGTICERLGFTMTAAFVAETLQLKPARIEGSARLYRESDFARICHALQNHIGSVWTKTARRGIAA